MHRVTIQKSIPYGDVNVVLACDAQGRSFVGVGLVKAGEGRFAFIQVDQVTALELERETVDLYTVITERCVGLVFEATPDAVEGDAQSRAKA